MTEGSGEKGEGRKLNITSKTLVRTMIQGGLAAVLAACGTLSEVKGEIPEVDLDKIISDPSLYSEAPILRTSGYPEWSRVKKTIIVPFFETYGLGPQLLKTKEWELDVIIFHTSPDPDSPSLEFVPYDTAYDAIDKTDLVIEDLYEVTGQVSLVKDIYGKGRYIFNPSAIEKVETPTPASSK